MKSRVCDDMNTIGSISCGNSLISETDGIIGHFHGKTVKELWEEFGDIPMNPETECIEVQWCEFPAGTHREEIWYWFEGTFNVSVYDLRYS